VSWAVNEVALALPSRAHSLLASMMANIDEAIDDCCCSIDPLIVSVHLKTRHTGTILILY